MSSPEELRAATKLRAACRQILGYTRAVSSGFLIGNAHGVEHQMTRAKGSTLFFTVDEAAAVLRTTRKGIYAMHERRQLPGATRIGRRLLIRQDDLLDWLDRCRTPSPKESRR